MKFLNRLIPEEVLKVKNIKNELILNIFHNTYFAEGNWILYYLTIVSYRTIGVIDALSIGIGLLLEIPTGAIADLIGRKKTVVLASFLISLGIFIQGFALDQWALLFGNLIFFAGMAFFSGANDALTYDSFKDEGKTELYDVFVFRSKIFATVAYISAVLIGGYVYQFDPRLPFIIWGCTHFIAFIVSLFLSEPKIDSYVFSFKKYIRQSVQGFKEFFKKQLRPFVFFIVTILGVSYIYEWGLLKPSVGVSFGFGAAEMSYVFLIEGLISPLLYYNFKKIRKKTGDYIGLVILNFLLIISFFLFSRELGAWGAFPMILMSLVSSLANPWIVIIVNKYTNSEVRATTLSTLAMILKLPYVLTIAFLGNLINEGFLKSTLLYMAIGLLVIALIEVIATARIKRKNNVLTNGQ